MTVVELNERQIGFSEEEFGRRLQAVRQKMAEKDIDALISTTTENIYYLTGYQTFGGAQQALIVLPDSDPVLVLRHFESYLVAYTSWLEPGRSVTTWEDSDDPNEAVIRALEDLRLTGKRLGVESGRSGLTVGLYERLSETCTVVDATRVVEDVRTIKSDSEIEAMRRAARFTEDGMRAAFEAVAIGNTENDVAAAAYDAMIRAGSEYLANDPIITAGYRSGIPHTTFCRYRLEKGDAVIIELGADYFRYFAPLMRTAVLGPCNDRTRSMYEACVDSLEAALSVIKPGITSGEAHQACQRVIDERGYKDNFRKRLGYGVGIGWQSWSEGHIVSLRENDETVLQAGMAFHMPPALRVVPEVGVGCSETIVVTETGCECLLDVPRDLVIN